MRRPVLLIPVLATLSVALAACATSRAAPSVPSLGSAAGGTPVSSQERAQLVHEAAACIRQHGIPGYQEPVVSPDGEVFSDIRSVENATQSAQDEARRACADLVTRAGFDPSSEPPAPPALVAAGVRAAACQRANGLPNMRDPNAQSVWTAGHGFAITGDEIPPGGKLSPAFQQAAQACRSLIDAEIQASTLGSLSNG